MKEIMYFVILVTVLFSLVSLLVIGLIYGLDKPSCSASTRDIGLPSRWSFWGGCQVEISEGRWIPLDNWYYVEKK
jgi:hypothetical protein